MTSSDGVPLGGTAIVQVVRKLRANRPEERCRSGRREDRNIGDRKMRYLFIFLSPMFLSACRVPLGLGSAGIPVDSGLRISDSGFPSDFGSRFSDFRPALPSRPSTARPLRQPRAAHVEALQIPAAGGSSAQALDQATMMRRRKSSAGRKLGW